MVLVLFKISSKEGCTKLFEGLKRFFSFVRWQLKSSSSCCILPFTNREGNIDSDGSWQPGLSLEEGQGDGEGDSGEARGAEEVEGEVGEEAEGAIINTD